MIMRKGRASYALASVLVFLFAQAALAQTAKEFRAMSPAEQDAWIRAQVESGIEGLAKGRATAKTRKDAEQARAMENLLRAIFVPAPRRGQTATRGGRTAAFDEVRRAIIAAAERPDAEQAFSVGVAYFVQVAQAILSHAAGGTSFEVRPEVVARELSPKSDAAQQAYFRNMLGQFPGALRPNSSPPTAPRPSEAASRYNAPGIITPLQERRHSDIPDDMLVRNYVVSILAGLKDSCPKFADSRPAGVMNVIAYVGYEERKSLQNPNNLIALLALGALGGETFGDLMAADFIQKHLVREGVDDGAALAKSEGCDSGTLARIYDDILKLATERAALPPDFSDPLRFRGLLSPALQVSMPAGRQDTELALPRQLLQKCIASPAGVKWCRCHIHALVDARVTDENLQSLLERYNDSTLRNLADRYPEFGKGVNSCVGTDIYRYPPRR